MTFAKEHKGSPASRLVTILTKEVCSQSFGIEPRKGTIRRQFSCIIRTGSSGVPESCSPIHLLHSLVIVLYADILAGRGMQSIIRCVTPQGHYTPPTCLYHTHRQLRGARILLPNTSPPQPNCRPGNHRPKSVPVTVHFFKIFFPCFGR